MGIEEVLGWYHEIDEPARVGDALPNPSISVALEDTYPRGEQGDSTPHEPVSWDVAVHVLACASPAGLEK